MASSRQPNLHSLEEATPESIAYAAHIWDLTAYKQMHIVLWSSIFPAFATEIHEKRSSGQLSQYQCMVFADWEARCTRQGVALKAQLDVCGL